MVRRVLLAALLCGVWAAPAQACRLALVLALDVSASVDDTEDRLQREGLAAALLAPEVQAALFASPDPVAVLAFEWSGVGHQTAITDWVIIKDPATLLSLAQTIRGSTRQAAGQPTALGHALAYSAVRLQDGPDCPFRTIDIAGDGANNAGFGPGIGYQTLPLDQVTVNGLVVAGAEDGVIDYYKRDVMRGTGAFVEVAEGYTDYEAAMRRKLLRELSAQIMGGTLSASGPRG